jgi:hypothetical protein
MNYATVLEVQDSPSSVVIDATGPLEPVPTTMQVLEVEHARAISPNELLG